MKKKRGGKNSMKSKDRKNNIHVLFKKDYRKVRAGYEKSYAV